MEIELKICAIYSTKLMFKIVLKLNVCFLSSVGNDRLSTRQRRVEISGGE